MKPKAPDQQLKRKKKSDEWVVPLSLDALISEYGVGIKQAGFWLADIVKVIRCA
jgi:hypothetical protein